jgi:hypothetical protein
MWHVWGIRNIYAGVWLGDLTEGRHTYRWEDNNQVCLIEIGWEGTVWIDVTKDSDRWQAVNMAMLVWVP